MRGGGGARAHCLSCLLGAKGHSRLRTAQQRARPLHSQQRIKPRPHTVATCRTHHFTGSHPGRRCTLSHLASAKAHVFSSSSSSLVRCDRGRTVPGQPTGRQRRPRSGAEWRRADPPSPPPPTSASPPGPTPALSPGPLSLTGTKAGPGSCWMRCQIKTKRQRAWYNLYGGCFVCVCFCGAEGPWYLGGLDQ